MHRFLLVGLLLIAGLVSSPVSAQQKKMSDYQCAAGNNQPYKGNNDPWDSYPYTPAYDIHPTRGDCFDNGETLFSDPSMLVHPAACYSTLLQRNARNDPSVQPGTRSIATKESNLESYVCGLNTRFATVDDYCGYVGMPGPLPTDNYAVAKAKLSECFKIYIPEFAQLADRGKSVLTRYNPAQAIEGGTVINTPTNWCYNSWLTESMKGPLKSEMEDAFGHGPTQQRKFPTGKTQEFARIRDACHPWSPRHNYQEKDTTLGGDLASFFGYDARCANWYGEKDVWNKDRMDIMAERLHRFDEYFFQVFKLPEFSQFCKKDCKETDIANCEEYKYWLQEFYKARNEACTIIERNYSNVLPPTVISAPKFGGSQGKAGSIEAEEYFSARWAYEEPNINGIAPIANDPGIVTKKDDTPQPKKSKELIIGSAFKGGADSPFPPFPAPTVPVYGPPPVITPAADILTTGLAKTNINNSVAANTLFNAPPETSKLSVIQGVPGCDQGGAFELMLYQARCMNWFGTSCLCDYDKTFRQGSALSYVLRRAGARIELINDKKDEYGNLVTDPKTGAVEKESSNFPWPMVDRGYLNDGYAKRYLKDSAALKTGLNNARPGNIIIWRNTQGVPRHAAYVEEVSWENELSQCVPAGGQAAGTTGTRPQDHIVITEMNNGKFRDICGNSDQWGQVTERTLYYSTAPIPALPDGSSPDCGNSDAATCRETNWAKIEVYDPRDTSTDGSSYGKNVWGKWDSSKAKDTELSGNVVDPEPPVTCDLPKDFNCPDKDTEESAKYCKKDSDGNYTATYTADQKKEIFRKRQQWVWGKVDKNAEAAIEDCTSGKVEDCCPPGGTYRCLIGCDPPVGLRKHKAYEAYPSLSLNTLQGRAPLVGPDAVIDMTTRGCPIFPKTFHKKDDLVCNRACGHNIDSNAVKNDENYMAPACPIRPGGCPQGIKRPLGCSQPPNTTSGGSGGGGGGGGSSGSGSGSGGTNGSSGGTNGSSGTTGSSGGTTGSSGSGSSTGGSSGSSTGGSSTGSSGSSSGGDIEQCSQTPAEPSDSCNGSCPPKPSCNWAKDPIYSEIFIEKLLRGSSPIELPYLPYLSLTDPKNNQTIRRVDSPAKWLDEEGKSSLWNSVIVGTKKELSKGIPKPGDIAVIIDSRYCVGQAGVIESVELKNGQDCVTIRSTNWQKGCDQWSETTCWQSCDAKIQSSLHTVDPQLKDKTCLVRSDLGQDGFIFTPP